ncbi:hypothetical protein M436DRAFT_66741 [Aureobasidium namibiae CBS 147.97]|uniref:Uncharacterized protein n=1 Tax=Aureobasidium namibiae CBS 147.97 TaxID=1043004 RepID=A0A074WEA2_9PEZI
MDTPIVTAPSDVFNFLGLPSELRNRIYQLHLSKNGGVKYETWSYYRLLGIRINHKRPTIRPHVGVNILRVCRQVYLEAVKYAYTDRVWNLGYDFDCARHLDLMPDGTAEKIQQLRLTARVDLHEPDFSVRAFTLGDFTRLKSLQILDLHVAAGLSLIPEDRSKYLDSPRLVDLVCHVLSHIPIQVEIIWSSPFNESVAMECISRGCPEEIVGELDAALEHIAHKYAAIKGCNYAIST